MGWGQGQPQTGKTRGPLRVSATGPDGLGSAWLARVPCSGLLVTWPRAVWRAWKAAHRSTYFHSLASLRGLSGMCLLSHIGRAFDLLQSFPAQSLNDHCSLLAVNGLHLWSLERWRRKIFPCTFKVRKESEEHKYWADIAEVKQTLTSDTQKQRLATHSWSPAYCISSCVWGLCLCLCFCFRYGAGCHPHTSWVGSGARCDFLRILFTVRCYPAPEQSLREGHLFSWSWGSSRSPPRRGRHHLLPWVTPPCQGWSSHLVIPGSSGTSSEGFTSRASNPLVWRHCLRQVRFGKARIWPFSFYFSEIIVQLTGLVGGSWLCVDKRAGWGNGESGQLGPGHIHPRDPEQVVYLLRGLVSSSVKGKWNCSLLVILRLQHHCCSF